MLEDRVFGIEQTLGILDRDVDVDPVLGRAVVKLVDAVGEEPLVDQVETVLGRLDELIDILNAEMLAIAGMSWVRDWSHRVSFLPLN